MTAAPVSTSAGVESAQAANELYEQYHDRIYAFCMSRTRNPTDAEDATQTAFMHALNGLRRGVVPQFELTWLLRIAENVCHSMHRRAYRRYERDELPLDLTNGQEDIALVTERFDTLCGALESLPEQQRRAILLREWRGLSYDDIADELGVTHAAVETTLFRARRTLVKQLGSLALFPFPALGRFAQWLTGPAGAKAAAVAVVSVGSATAVVASAPVDAPSALRAGPASVAPLTSQSRSTLVPPAADPVRGGGVSAPEAPALVPAEPRVGADDDAASTPAPASPLEPAAAGPVATPPAVETTPPTPGAVEVPATPPVLPLPLPIVPETTELLNPVVDLTEDVEEALPVDLAPLPPLPPVLPGP